MITTWICSSGGLAVPLVLNSCCLIHTVPVTVHCQAMGANCADGSILLADSVPVSLCQGPVWVAGILHYAQVRVCPHIHTAGKPRDSTACRDQCSHQTLGSVEMGSHAVHVSTNTKTIWTIAHQCTVYHHRGAPVISVTKKVYNNWLHSSMNCVPSSNDYIKWRWKGISLYTWVQCFMLSVRGLYDFKKQNTTTNSV
jgi:hypothetical protein